MIKFIEKFYKKTRQVQIGFPSLHNLRNDSRLEKLLKIVSIFELQDIQFVGSGFVEQNSTFLTAPQDLDSSVEVIIKKTNKRLFSKNLFHEINIKFCGKWLAEIIKLTILEETTLFIVPVDDDGVSQVELRINDNDEFSAVTFSIDKYDHDETISKINQILN